MVAFFIAGCSTNSVLVSDKNLASAPSKKHRKSDAFLVDLEQLSGNTAYIDRKYFKKSLRNYLEERRAKLAFNPDAHLLVDFNQTIIDENRFTRVFENQKQYRLDKKVSIIVDYTMKGKSSYHNSFTYNVLLKSGSFVSYDDADRKTHILLFNKLGEMVGKRVIALKHRFR